MDNHCWHRVFADPHLVLCCNCGQHMPVVMSRVRDDDGRDIHGPYCTWDFVMPEPEGCPGQMAMNQSDAAPDGGYNQADDPNVPTHNGTWRFAYRTAASDKEKTAKAIVSSHRGVGLVAYYKDEAIPVKELARHLQEQSGIEFLGWVGEVA